MWSFRLMQEERHALSSYFITLTYDTKFVPISKKGYMTLDKRDVQLFMKRLRKDNKNQLKYYICGEYGSKTDRPHYHMILFNADITTIQDNWAKGQIHYGGVNEASVGYTLKYMMKEKKIPKHQNDDRLREFSLMSKGLGKKYLTKEMLEWHNADHVNRLYCNLKDGKKISMPRYYKDKVFNRQQRGEQKEYFTNYHREQAERLALDEIQAMQILKQIKNAENHDRQKIKKSMSERKN